MTTTVDPDLLEALRNGDLQLSQHLIAENIDQIRELSTFDVYFILRTSIEGNIHHKIFLMLVTGMEDDAERETALLRLTLRNGNLSMAWMILNRWRNIERLDLSNCMLTAIPSMPSRHCETLKELDLSGNLIQVLTLSPDKFPSLRHVNLEGNPLTPYPEKCRTSWSRMKDFIQKLNRRATDGIFKKLIIVGDPGSGKTSMLKALQKYFKSSTEYAETGFINTAQVTIQDEAQEITLNVWDMGAEDSAIRNFFITSRAVYILSFDPSRSDAMERVCFWLQLIQSLCKASPSSPSTNYEFITPVFIVASEDKMLPGVDSDDMEESFRRITSKILFRGFQGFYPVCCKSGKGIKTLMGDMVRFIKQQIGARSGVSANWVLLNDCLHRMKRKKTSFLDWESYETLTKKCQIKKSVLQSCTTFLRDCGTLLLYTNAANFWDNKSPIILDPQWLYNMLLCIFHDKRYIQNGFCSMEAIPILLSNYPSFMQDFALSLLSQYNVIHRLSVDQFLIPSMLSQACPFRELRSFWSPTSSELEHQRIFEFSFLPLEFFPRVIVRILQVKGVVGSLFWKNGVLFELSSQSCSQKCILTYDENNYKLFIKVRISNVSTSETGAYGMLFRHIIEVVEVLLESYYPRLVQNTKRLVPCTHCLSRNAIEPYIFTYFQCINAVTSGKGYLYCFDIQSPSRCVSLVQLAPDVSFVDLLHITEADLVIGDVIGEGSFGFVYSGKWKNKPVAIKSLKGGQGEEERLKFWEFQQESCVMSGLDHPNIVNLYGVTSNPPRMVMELLLGDLCNHMIHPIDPKDPAKQIRIPVQPYKYSWKLRMRIAYDIAKGMQYLQNISPPIIHRDLRSPNIFLVSLDVDAPICAKVADFGLSRAITSGISGSLSTWQWLAPEVILEDGGEYDITSDVYSFGIVLWELVTFEYPFDEFQTHPRYSRTITDGNGDSIQMLNPNDVKYSIIHDQLRPTIPKECPEDISNLITRCWHQNPKKRPKFDEIVYILSMELAIQLDDVSFNSTSFARRHVSVNLGAELSSCDEVTEDTLDSPKDSSVAVFSEYIKTGDRYVSCMEQIPQTHEVWTGTSDGAIVIRDARDGSVIFSIIDAHERRVTSICVVEDKIWTSSADGTIQVWKPVSRMNVKTLRYSGETYSIKCLCPVSLPNGKLQVWSSSPRVKTLHCWDAKSYDLVREISTSHEVHAMSQCDDCVWLGMENGGITLISSQDAKTIGSWEGSQKTIGSFLRYQSCVWSGSDSGEITMWFYDKDSEENKVSYLYSSLPHFSSVNSLHKIYQYVWTASNDHSIIIWDAEDLKPLYEFADVHKDAILCVLAVDTNTVWSSSTDGSIGVWRVKPPSIKMKRAKSRSQSMQNERKDSTASTSRDSLTKFTSMPMNREKKIHPCLFKTSHPVTLQSPPSTNRHSSKMEPVSTESSPRTPQSGSRRMRKTVSNITKFMKSSNTSVGTSPPP